MYLSPIKLKDLVSYNQTHLESKILKEDGDKKIILFALLEGQILPKHETPIEAFMYVLKGSLTFKTSAKSVIINEKEIMTIPPKEEHEVFANEKSKFLIIRI